MLPLFSRQKNGAMEFTRRKDAPFVCDWLILLNHTNTTKAWQAFIDVDCWCLAFHSTVDCVTYLLNQVM